MLINSPNISGSLTVTGNATISGSLNVAGGINATITGSATSASYVEYSNVANKPTLVSGSEQISFNGIVDKPTLVSGSSQIVYSEISSIPAGIVSGSSQVSFNGIVDKPTLVSGSSQVTYSGLTGIPAGIVSSSAQIAGYNLFATTGSNQFNGSQAITGSLTVTGQVVAQTLNVQQVTSSIVFSSGSNIFGNDLGNTQQFTGSLQVTGSTHYLLGSVGIGIAIPTNPLHIASNTLSQLNIQALSGNTNAQINLEPTGTGIALIGPANNVDLAFRTNSTTRMLISGSGNVGIGTTSPTDFGSTYKVLSINGSSGGGVLDLMVNNTRFLTLAVDGSEPSISSRIDGLPIVFRTNNGGTVAERMRITSGGNVGIGVSPDVRLDVLGTSDTSDVVRIRKSSTGSIRGALGTQSGVGYLDLYNDSSALSIRLLTDGSSYFNGGNVGIGTASPDTLLHLSSTTDTSILRLERNSTTITSGQSYGQIQWEGQDASSAAAGVRGSIDVISEGNLGETKMVLRTSGANFNANLDRLTINSAGAATFSSSVTATAAYINNASFTEGVTYFDIDTFGGKILRLNNAGNQLIMGTNGIVTIGSVGNNGSGAVLQVTGASTFSSSVTAGGYITGQGNNPGGLGGSRYVLDWVSGQMRLFSYGANSSTNGGFLFNSQRSDGTNSINYLDIASTGIATFSTTENQGGVYVTSATDNTTLRVSSTAANGQEWRMQSTGGTSGLGQGKLIFKVGDTETASHIPLTLTTDNSTNGGRVGIGTTSPSFRFETLGTSAIVAGFGRSDFGATNVTLIGINGFRDVYKSAIGVVRTNEFDVGDMIFCLNGSTNSTVVSSSDERMRITSGGNVGIGTDIPAVSLHVQKNSGIYELIQIQNNSAGALLRAIGLGGGSADFGADDTAASTAVIRTAGTERMRITSGGYLKASNDGTYSSPTGTFHEIRTSLANNNVVYLVNTSASNPYGPYINFLNAAPNDSVKYFLLCADSTASRLEVRSNGGIANYQANDVNLSDERTKKDISPLESYWDKFKDIQIVKFKYKDQTHDDYNIGVIAQQVEAVAPEFVDVDGWDTKPKLDEEGNTIVSEEEPLKSIYTADLHHATIKVLQEAMAKIESLEAILQRNNIS